MTAGLEGGEDTAVGGGSAVPVTQLMEETNKIGKKDEVSGHIVTTQSHFNVSYVPTTDAPSTTTTTTVPKATSDPNYKSTPLPTPTTTTTIAVETSKVSTTKPHLTKTPKSAETALAAKDGEKNHQEEISEATVERQTKWKNFGMIAVLIAGLSLMFIGCWRFKVEGDSLRESFLEEATMDMEGNY